MSKVNLIFFNFDKEVPLIAELTEMYSSREEFEVQVLASADEVNQLLMTSQNGILFFNLGTKKDLQRAVGILKSNRKNIKKGLIKPCAITAIQNKKIESLLAKYGCQDLLEPTTKPKTLTFKLNFWSKPIRKQLQKIEAEEQMRLKRASQKKDAEANEEKADFQMVSPLELQSDFWLVKAKADYKKILRRYLIRMLGPSPYVGNWIELDPQPGDKQPTWKWVQKDADNEDYIVDDGAWFFYGAKPEFDWKISRWSFASDLPHLYFYTRKREVFSRFKIEDGVVNIAENSEFALMRENMILEACDGKFNIEGDRIKEGSSENFKGEGSEADNMDGTLSGKGSAADSYGENPLVGKGYKADDVTGALNGKGSSSDHFGDDPLSGKSSVDEYGKDPLGGKDSAADHFGDDPLSGKAGVDAMGNPLGGKGSASDHFGDDPLSGKAGTDAMGNPLGGKGSASDHFGDDPLQGRANTDAMGNPLSGKGSAADHFGDDPLSGKAGTDAMGNPLGGKGSASDHFGDDPLSGKAGTDAMGNPLGGKGSAADHYGDDPLQGRANTDAMGNPLDGQGSKSDEYGKDPLQGRANTDAMGNPLGGKGSAADHYGDDPLSGKAGTDAMGNPLDGQGSKADEYGKDPLQGRAVADVLGKPVDGKGSKADEYGKDPLQGRLDKAMEKPGVVDPAEVPINPQLVDQLLDNAPDISPELKEQLKQAQSLEDLLPGIEDMSPEEIEEALKKMGIDDDILDALNLSQPLLKMKKQKKAVAELPSDLQEKLKKVDSIQDLIPNIEDMSSAEIEEAKQKLGIDDALLDTLNLGQPIEEAKQKQEAIAALPEELQEKAKKAQDISDLIPNAENMTPEELAEAKKKLGIDDDILDKLNLNGPILDQKQKAKNMVIANKRVEDAFEEENLYKLDPMGNPVQLQDPSEVGDYLEEAEAVGDYFNENKRKAEEIREREAALEKEYAAREAAKKDDELNKHEVNHGAGSFGEKPTPQQREQELFEALGGGLTDGEDMADAIGMIGGGSEAEEVEEKPAGDTVIDGQASTDLVNTESGELKVVLKQKTDSGSEINFLCEFEDFYEDEIVVKIPKGSLEVDSEVTAVVTLEYNGSQVEVESQGKVGEIEELSDTKETLIINISKIDSTKYETFIKLYEDRQESIANFMELAKGY